MVSAMLAALLALAFVSCEAYEKTCTAGASCPIEMDPEVGANLNLLQTGIRMHSVDYAEKTPAERATVQCETSDTSNKLCADASTCCEGHGCGGFGEGDTWKSSAQCYPCSWKSYNTKFTSDSCPKPAVATVPVVWQVIKTKTGKGHMSAEEINVLMDDVNKRFSGVDVDSPDVTGVLANGTCQDKCNVALCYKKGTATDDTTKQKVNAECFCGDGFCKSYGWKFNKLYGERLDTGVRFKVDSINYVTNDDWHFHCCCAHADKPYKPKQMDIFDQLIDKTTVRSKATVIVCEMKPKNGGGTAGQSSIAGGKYCSGGPGIMVDREAMRPTKSDGGEGANTLTHELGHFFGLYHTFNEFCPPGMCKPEDICNPTVNKGDRVDDTPVMIKQGQCKMDASGETVDSCPNSPGRDPVDNFMSYSSCPQQRFTQGQVARMIGTIKDYFPALLTNSDGLAAKDLPCDPGFSPIPEGYKTASKPTPATSPGGATTTLSPSGDGSDMCSDLEADQCATDKTGCVCAAATNCCENFGCATWKGMDGPGTCLPCSWNDGSGNPLFTTDSCKTN